MAMRALPMIAHPLQDVLILLLIAMTEMLAPLMLAILPPDVLIPLLTAMTVMPAPLMPAMFQQDVLIPLPTVTMAMPALPMIAHPLRVAHTLLLIVMMVTPAPP